MYSKSCEISMRTILNIYCINIVLYYRKQRKKQTPIEWNEISECCPTLIPSSSFFAFHLVLEFADNKWANQTTLVSYKLNRRFSPWKRSGAKWRTNWHTQHNIHVGHQNVKYQQKHTEIEGQRSASLSVCESWTKCFSMWETLFIQKRSGLTLVNVE